MSFALLLALCCGQVSVEVAPEVVTLPPEVRIGVRATQIDVEAAAIVAKRPACECGGERKSVRERQHCHGRHCCQASAKVRTRERRS